MQSHLLQFIWGPDKIIVRCSNSDILPDKFSLYRGIHFPCMWLTMLFSLSPEIILAEVTAEPQDGVNFMVQSLSLEMQLVNHKCQIHHKEDCTLGST